jgi:transcriptional regulator of arginine metabolism
MTEKIQRQKAIRLLLREQEIHTQEELAELLASRHDIHVTQVTLSRDLRDLDLVKSAQGYRELSSSATPQRASLDNILTEFVQDIQTAAALVVLRTTPGHASTVAVALDRAGREEVVGTIAGDDTIFIATRSNEVAAALAARLRRESGFAS